MGWIFFKKKCCKLLTLVFDKSCHKVIKVENLYFSLQKSITFHHEINIKRKTKGYYRILWYSGSQNAPPNENETSKKITKKNKNSSPECKRIYIIGDSILKHVHGHDISKSLENCKTYVKSFSGAKIRDMQDYVKPTSRENPDQIIVHVGTNDLA